MNNHIQQKNELIEICKRTYNKGFSPGISGNVSLRNENLIFVTQSGISLADVDENSIAIIDMEGNILTENIKPTSEKNMHLKIYQKRPDIGAIIHVHSPKSTAFAISNADINKPILAEGLVLLGPIVKADYALPSSDDLAENVSEAFKNSDIVLLANHGVAVCGKNLKDAYYQLETLEMYAETYLNAMLLGKINEFSKENIDELLELRRKIQS